MLTQSFLHPISIILQPHCTVSLTPTPLLHCLSLRSSNLQCFPLPQSLCCSHPTPPSPPPNTHTLGYSQPSELSSVLGFRELLWSPLCRLGLPVNQSLSSTGEKTLSYFPMSALAFLLRRRTPDFYLGTQITKINITYPCSFWPRGGHSSNVIANAVSAWSMPPQ